MLYVQKIMKDLFLKPIFFFVSFFTLNVSAQENKHWKVDFRADLFSRHLWRGGQLGDAPAIEPEIMLTKGNFGFSVWGATTFNNSYNEIDIILNYNVLPFLNISFYDYYNPVPNSQNQFWKYKGNEMRHSLELTADLGKDDFPLTLLAGVFLYGDKDSITSNERFSTYIEPGYIFKIANQNFRLFAGFTPFNGYYAGNFAFINVGAAFSDSFAINPKLELPVEITFCTNPSTNQTWFVAGIGIKSRN
ncbi:MAG: hypothetical protein FD181_598 [Prolixibacteraceae bacterium]|nr:MAG: hypothetical protein FD181_598 [Prolixibacteraceae bacterium]